MNSTKYQRGNLPLLSIIAVVLVLVSLITIIVFIKKPQDIRSRACGNTVSNPICWLPPPAPPGEEPAEPEQTTCDDVGCGAWVKDGPINLICSAGGGCREPQGPLRPPNTNQNPSGVNRDAHDAACQQANPGAPITGTTEEPEREYISPREVFW